MPTSDRSYAGQLARAVIKELGGSRFRVHRLVLPKSKSLTRLFETMYAVSLKTEEAQRVRCSVALMPPWYWLNEAKKSNRGMRCYPFSMPLPEPKLIEFNRWVSFNEQNLRKLAHASDPTTSAIAVGPDSGDHLVIFGLLDQILHYNRFLERQNKRPPQIPGILLCAIEGQGQLSIYKGFQFVAGLDHTRILRKLSHPLAGGPIWRAMLAGSDRLINSEIAIASDYAKELVPGGVPLPKQLRGYLRQKWLSTVSRLLQQIQHYGHGATLLALSSDQSPSDRQLEVKYRIHYSRISGAFGRMCRIEIMRILGLRSANRLIKRKDKTAVDEGKGLAEFWESERPQEQLRQADAELEGAIAFVASLSRVDGSVICDDLMNVNGFGVEIRASKDPPELHLASDALGKSLVRGDISSYGTRHRSVMRFCWANPGGIGFVVSHDGNLRAVLRVGNKLLMWDSVDHRQLWLGERWA